MSSFRGKIYFGRPQRAAEPIPQASPAKYESSAMNPGSALGMAGRAVFDSATLKSSGADPSHPQPAQRTRGFGGPAWLRRMSVKAHDGDERLARDGGSYGHLIGRSLGRAQDISTPVHAKAARLGIPVPVWTNSFRAYGVVGGVFHTRAKSQIFIAIVTRR